MSERKYVCIGCLCPVKTFRLSKKRTSYWDTAQQDKQLSRNFFLGHWNVLLGHPIWMNGWINYTLMGAFISWTVSASKLTSIGPGKVIFSGRASNFLMFRALPPNKQYLKQRHSVTTWQKCHKQCDKQCHNCHIQCHKHCHNRWLALWVPKGVLRKKNSRQKKTSMRVLFLFFFKCLNENLTVN